MCSAAALSSVVLYRIGAADSVIPEKFGTLHAWRRQVVRWWIATMIVALLAWCVAAALPLSRRWEAVLGGVLLLIIGIALYQTHRGRCPRCDARIRFEPRIELPRHCPRCGADFMTRKGPDEPNA